MAKDICEQMFEKQVYDEVDGLTRSFYIPTRQIRMAALRGEGLKELSVETRSILMEFATNLLNLCDSYGTHFGINGSIKEKYTSLMNFYQKKCLEFGYSNVAVSTNNKGLSSLVNNVRRALHEIDSTINFIQNAYKIADNKDERWNKATVRSVIVSNNEINNSYGDSFDPNAAWKEIDAIDEKLKKNKIDLYSPEYGKVILKKLRSYKADIISATNKYFGKNSPFAELKVSELITM